MKLFSFLNRFSAFCLTLSLCSCGVQNASSELSSDDEIATQNFGVTTVESQTATGRATIDQVISYKGSDSILKGMKITVLNPLRLTKDAISFPIAQDACKNLKYGRENGWRLPTTAEVTTLVAGYLALVGDGTRGLFPTEITTVWVAQTLGAIEYSQERMSGARIKTFYRYKVNNLRHPAEGRELASTLISFGGEWHESGDARSDNTAYYALTLNYFCVKN